MSEPGTCTIACDVREDYELHAPVCWQEQVVAERAIRQAVEEDYEAAEGLIDLLVDVIAERDQQIVALREAGEAAEYVIRIAEAFADYASGVDWKGPCQGPIRLGEMLYALESYRADRALLATPAGEAE